MKSLPTRFFRVLGVAALLAVAVQFGASPFTAKPVHATEAACGTSPQWQQVGYTDADAYSGDPTVTTNNGHGSGTINFDITKFQDAPTRDHNVCFRIAVWESGFGGYRFTMPYVYFQITTFGGGFNGCTGPWSTNYGPYIKATSSSFVVTPPIQEWTVQGGYGGGCRSAANQPDPSINATVAYMPSGFTPHEVVQWEYVS